MKNSTLMLVSVLLSGATAAGVVSVMPERSAAPARAAGSEPEVLASLARTLAALQTEQARVADQLVQLDMRLGTQAGEGRVDLGAIDAAVARYLDERGALPGDGLARAPRAGNEEPSLEARGAFEQLLDEDLDDVQSQAMWKRLAEEGLAEEVLALFEQAADEDPSNPEKRVELGLAYLNRIQEVGNGPAAGVYADKADAAFDAALELDSNHWDARFNKAVALSFWPPVFGKQGAAIEQFETLVAQQAGLAPTQDHATTHYLLGNMYQQIGNAEKALAAWRLGASLFPDDAALAEQLRIHGGQ